MLLNTLENLFKPPVEVTECVLTSNPVQSEGQTSIRFTIKNNDERKSYIIRVEFSSNERVTFFLGSKQLQKQGDIWLYEESINPLATHTQFINVRPTLEKGVSKISYRIHVKFYRNGTEFFSKNLDLTVYLP